MRKALTEVIGTTPTPAQAKPARYYVATYGDFGLEVEFFSCPLAYGRACRAAERGWKEGEFDTHTNGHIHGN